MISPYKNISGELKETINTKVLCLLKVGHEENLKKFANGDVYCRHLAHYKSIENKNRSSYDEHEGLAGIYQSDQIKIHIKDKEGNPFIISAENGLTGQVIVSMNDKMPTFCLHTMHTGEWTNRHFTENEMNDFKKYLQVPSLMSKHGDNVCVITNGLEFNNRLIEACKKRKINFKHGLVQYLDESYVHGGIPKEMVGFVKRIKFSHEREYRYMFYSDHELSDPFKINIGSLNDITKISKLGDFKKDWQIEFV